jgi:integrase
MNGSMRERSKGSYELRYRHAGRRVSVTFRGTKTEAARELRRRLRLVDTGEHLTDTRETTEGWLRRWLGIVQQEVRPITFIGYSNVVMRHLIPALGMVPTGKLTPAHIQTLQSELAAQGKAPGTRRRIHRILSGALSRGVELGVLVRNPCDALRGRLPKVEQKEITVLSGAAQTRQILDETAESRYGIAFLLSIATGARRAEICALRWRNIDLDERTVRIAEAMTQIGTKLITGPTKSKRARSVSLPSAAVDTLRRALAEQKELGLRLGYRVGPDSYVCADHEGAPLHPNALTNYARRLFDRLGLPMHLHSMRHSHATALMLAGTSAKVVQERLGHSSVKVTLDVYSHLTDILRDDAADKIDAVMRG